jgi:hypothetical protein
MSSINNRRRYYLCKSRFFNLFPPEGDAMKAVYWTKQGDVAGTALPIGFPLKDRLATARYTTEEDLDGADTAELVQLGFTGAEVAEILAAASAL